MENLINKFIELREKHIQADLINRTNGVDCHFEQFLVVLEYESIKNYKYSEGFDQNPEKALANALQNWYKRYGEKL